MNERCEMCGGETFYLGQLGNIIWQQCRYCGYNQGTKADDFVELDATEESDLDKGVMFL